MENHENENNPDGNWILYPPPRQQETPLPKPNMEGTKTVRVHLLHKRSRPLFAPIETAAFPRNRPNLPKPPSSFTPYASALMPEQPSWIRIAPVSRLDSPSTHGMSSFAADDHDTAVSDSEFSTGTEIHKITGPKWTLQYSESESEAEAEAEADDERDYPTPRARLLRAGAPHENQTERLGTAVLKSMPPMELTIHTSSPTLASKAGPLKHTAATQPTALETFSRKSHRNLSPCSEVSSITNELPNITTSHVSPVQDKVHPSPHRMRESVLRWMPFLMTGVMLWMYMHHTEHELAILDKRIDRVMKFQHRNQCSIDDSHHGAAVQILEEIAQQPENIGQTLTGEISEPQPESIRDAIDRYLGRAWLANYD